MSLQTIDPTTGLTVRDYAEMDPHTVSAIIDTAHNTQMQWRETTYSERAALMRNAARLLDQHAQEYARLMAEEMGKPIAGGEAEIEKCAWVCEYYADQADVFLADEAIASGASASWVAYRPLGVVLAVMPWNFPFWQVFRFAAPALMAGNAAVLKHGSNVCGSALAIEALFREAGFPQDLFRTLLIGSGQVAAVIEHPSIKAVTLTGSTAAGRAVAAKAGEQLKKTVLELGGSDPYLILDDADVEAPATTCAASRLINSGQSCIAAKRFIVVQPHLQRFEQLMVEKMSAARMGPPTEDGVLIGPQARTDLRDELHAQVRDSLVAGARLLCGGEVPEGPGAFYPPTVLTDVGAGMPAYAEELFGPVAAIIPVADEDEAIHVANDSVFGLGAAVFTADVERGKRIAADRLEAGACFVNDFVKSDPRLPFGGIKQSGYGRELAQFGIREFVNIKTIYVK